MYQKNNRLKYQLDNALPNKYGCKQKLEDIKKQENYIGTVF